MKKNVRFIIIYGDKMFDIEKFWFKELGRNVNFFEDMNNDLYDRICYDYYRMEKLKKNNC
jgi:hypothetical protein